MAREYSLFANMTNVISLLSSSGSSSGDTSSGCIDNYTSSRLSPSKITFNLATGDDGKIYVSSTHSYYSLDGWVLNFISKFRKNTTRQQHLIIFYFIILFWIYSTGQVLVIHLTTLSNLIHLQPIQKWTVIVMVINHDVQLEFKTMLLIPDLESKYLYFEFSKLE